MNDRLVIDGDSAYWTRAAHSAAAGDYVGPTRIYKAPLTGGQGTLLAQLPDSAGSPRALNGRLFLVSTNGPRAIDETTGAVTTLLDRGTFGSDLDVDPGFLWWVEGSGGSGVTRTNWATPPVGSQTVFPHTSSVGLHALTGTSTFLFWFDGAALRVANKRTLAITDLTTLTLPGLDQSYESRLVDTGSRLVWYTSPNFMLGTSYLGWYDLGAQTLTEIPADAAANGIAILAADSSGAYFGGSPYVDDSSISHQAGPGADVQTIDLGLTPGYVSDLGLDASFIYVLRPNDLVRVAKP
jgi:hypothetical protein